MPDPIQPKEVEEILNLYRVANPGNIPGPWEKFIARQFADLNKEILELREEIQKLKYPLVTIHTLRYKPPFTSDSSGNLGTGYC